MLDNIQNFSLFLFFAAFCISLKRHHPYNQYGVTPMIVVTHCNKNTANSERYSNCDRLSASVVNSDWSISTSMNSVDNEK